jgi:hypothetical protein
MPAYVILQQLPTVSVMRFLCEIKLVYAPLLAMELHLAEAEYQFVGSSTVASVQLYAVVN